MQRRQRLAISGKEEESNMYDTPSGICDKSNDEKGCTMHAWQVGDLVVIVDGGAPCHMSKSSAGTINYRESFAMQTAGRKRYLIEGFCIFIAPRYRACTEPRLRPFFLRATEDYRHTYTGNQEGLSCFSLYRRDSMFLNESEG